MRSKFIIFCFFVIIKSSYSQYVFDFVSKKENVFITTGSYNSNGVYEFLKFEKNGSKVNESKITVLEPEVLKFKDSLLKNGYSQGLKVKSIKRPKYILELSSYAFSYTAPKGDSIFEFSFNVILFPNSKNEQVISCGSFDTFSSKKELNNNFSTIDIYSSSYLHKGTTIKRLWFDLEKVSRKPFIYFDDNTIMDYNYSANILY